MKYKKPIAVLAVILIVGLSQMPQISYAETVDNAFKFCAGLDASNILSKPCRVSGWDQSIDITMNVTESEAKKMCSDLVGHAKKVDAQFDKGWKVRVYSSASDKKIIAECLF